MRLSTKIGIAIVLYALAVRGTIDFSKFSQVDATDRAWDTDAYVEIAQTLGTTGSFALVDESGEVHRTAYRPPLYPLLLSRLLTGGQVQPFAIAALHTLLGCITALCVYRASRVLLGEMEHHRASILAAVLVILDPLLLYQSTLPMTETLATALASVVVWWWVRHASWSKDIGPTAILGVLLALAYFCRPTFLLWGVLMLACVYKSKSFLPEKPRHRLGRTGLVAAILVAAVGIWAVRNQRAIKYPAWGTTHGGYTFLLGNNPLFYDYLRSDSGFGSTWDMANFEEYAGRLRTADDPSAEAIWSDGWVEPKSAPIVVSPEHALDQAHYQAALGTIAREPLMFIWSCINRVYRLWTPIPHRTAALPGSVVIACSLYYLALYAAVGFGLYRLGKKQLLQAKWWPIAALVVTLTAVHTFYWSNIRMRAPMMPFLAIIAASTIRVPEETKRD